MCLRQGWSNTLATVLNSQVMPDSLRRRGIPVAATQSGGQQYHVCTTKRRLLWLKHSDNAHCASARPPTEPFGACDGSAGRFSCGCCEDRPPSIMHDCMCELASISCSCPWICVQIRVLSNVQRLRIPPLVGEAVWAGGEAWAWLLHPAVRAAGTNILGGVAAS